MKIWKHQYIHSSGNKNQGEKSMRDLPSWQDKSPGRFLGLSLKRSQCKFGTALPCTTPRPAPKSSTSDLAWDLWARGTGKPAPLTLVGLRGGEMGHDANRPNPKSIRSAPDRGSYSKIAPTRRSPHKTKGRNPPPQSELYCITETGLVMATQISTGSTESRRGASLPSSSIDSTFRGLQV